MRRLTEASAAAIAQGIASALLAGPDSSEWKALATSQREAQEPLPSVIKSAVIQDVGDRPFLDRHIGWLFGEDSPPALQNASVVENDSIAISSLILPTRHDELRGFTFYDAGGDDGYLTVNGVAQPDGHWIYVAANDLANVGYVGGTAAGTDSLYLKAYNANTANWSISALFTVTTHAVPTVHGQNVAVAENAAIQGSSLITSISNPSNDNISEYAFYDAGGGNGHFTVNGVSEPDCQWFYVAASNLGEVDYVGGSSPGSDTLHVQVYDATAATWSSPSALTVTTTGSVLPLQYKGFDYVAFYNGAYENSDSLPSLAQTGANSIEATLDYGIDAQTSQVVADPNYTDSLSGLGDTIAQAEGLGLSVMVRPLIDFLDPTESAPYSVGEWRQDYHPTNVAAFFASYQQMIVAEAEVAQANGAQMLSIGAELDQLTGPQYLSYWTNIIDAVREVFSGALTYSASWNTASDVSFWNQLNYEGIDCYVPLSNAANPTLQQLVNGWLNPATPSSNPNAYAVIGSQSPIQYLESLAQQSGKPLIFTELGYANDAGAAADPSASGNSPDPALQAELYQAFFQAWAQSGSSSLIGTYFWEWDPSGSTSNVGPNIDSFSPQNSPAQAQATAGFEVAETIATGATIEIGGADSGTVTFAGATGILKLDDAPAFSGQIYNLTGTGNLSSSDQIDLKDVSYGPGTTVSYTGDASGGTLTVSDAQHDTARISLVGNYENSTFTLSNDGSGGTVVVDPPLSQDPANSRDMAVTEGRGGATGHSFIFEPGFDSLIMADSIKLRAAQWHEFTELHAPSNQNGTHTSFQKAEALYDTGMDPVQHHSFLLAQAHFAEMHPNNSFIIR